MAYLVWGALVGIIRCKLRLYFSPSRNNSLISEYEQGMHEQAGGADAQNHLHTARLIEDGGCE